MTSAPSTKVEVNIIAAGCAYKDRPARISSKETLAVNSFIVEVLIEPWRTFVPLKATSIRLDDATLEQLGQMADAMDRPRAWLMAHAIKQYVEREQWFISEIEKGIQSADEGRLLDHGDVRAKWEAKRATQMD